MFVTTARPVRFERDLLPKIVAPLLGTLLLLTVTGSGVRAAEKTFVITDTEGYGIMDCITEGTSCGRVVADAWCESHGFGAARAFGRASDITGAITISASVSEKPSPDAAVVACGD